MYGALPLPLVKNPRQTLQTSHLCLSQITCIYPCSWLRVISCYLKYTSLSVFGGFGCICNCLWLPTIIRFRISTNPSVSLCFWGEAGDGSGKGSSSALLILKAKQVVWVVWELWGSYHREPQPQGKAWLGCTHGLPGWSAVFETLAKEEQQTQLGENYGQIFWIDQKKEIKPTLFDTPFNPFQTFNVLHRKYAQPVGLNNPSCCADIIGAPSNALIFGRMDENMARWFLKPCSRMTVIIQLTT